MQKVLFVLFVFVLTAFAQDGGLMVEQMDFCTAVEERQPVGIDTAFADTVERVYCYTKISGAADTTSISHVWYHNDKEMAKIDLAVRAKNWRTWSSKRIMETWTGSWRVDVTDVTGAVIKSKKFVVQ